MRIEIISDVMISGEPHQVGSLLEVSQSVANLLIGSNKAQPAPEPEAPVEAPKRSRKSAPTPEVES